VDELAWAYRLDELACQAFLKNGEAPILALQTLASRRSLASTMFSGRLQADRR